ncbi:NAD(P)H-dependent oxidoreductase [uncultured Tateyamaria sp.]|uniref:FMN-dependent NADH-azoreductase n=1 Tax=uncultured Tateyamaria sp. TaxID=455651 RepID=UPI0026301003|nr:NAD(P)H-dependent oxidoreductase [uncultured Tateyamaria sp.]
MTSVLHVTSSVRQNGSASLSGGHAVIERLQTRHETLTVTTRAVSDEATFLTEDWVGASFTPADERTLNQHAMLATSDAMVQELLDADILVISASMYNFGLPAALKAWVDHVARPGVTFRPDPEQTYVGLATGKTAYVVVATGETPVMGDMDFVSPYLVHVLGFLGLTDVHVIAADMTVVDPASLDRRVTAQIDALF